MSLRRPPCRGIESVGDALVAGAVAMRDTGFQHPTLSGRMGLSAGVRVN
jgi:hypothetical protein